MTPVERGRELLAGLAELGVNVWLKGPGRIGYRTSQPVEHEELVACLRDWKHDLVAALTSLGETISTEMRA